MGLYPYDSLAAPRRHETDILLGEYPIHLMSAGSAKPVFRDAHDRRHFSPKSEYRFENSVPNRLLEQTRLILVGWNPRSRRA